MPPDSYQQASLFFFLFPNLELAFGFKWGKLSKYETGSLKFLQWNGEQRRERGQPFREKKKTNHKLNCICQHLPLLQLPPGTTYHWAVETLYSKKRYKTDHPSQRHKLLEHSEEIVCIRHWFDIRVRLQITGEVSQTSSYKKGSWSVFTPNI